MRLTLPLRGGDLVCREVVAMINDYLEDALPRRSRARLERHLATCPHCTAYLHQMRTTVTLTRRLVPEDLSPELQREFTDVFRRWRSETQDADGSG